MKTILSIFLTITTYSLCFGQEKTIITLKDTINLKGVISYEDGTPAKNLLVNSKKYPKLIYSRTDTNGYFELKPFPPSDTLIVYHNNLFAINGSRFVNLLIQKNGPNLTGEIKGKRISPNESKSLEFSYEPAQIFEGVVHALPSYPGGNEVFLKRLKAIIKYPQKAIENNISGEVVIKFTIDSNGNVINPRLIKGIGYDCEIEVAKAILICGKWMPGIKNGYYYDQDFYFHYFFTLED